MSALVKVDFHGDELLANQDERGVWVVFKRVCESLELGYASQTQKLKGKPWATVTTIVTVAEDGKPREMLALHLDALPMWLATIDAGRVAPAVRAKIERYQVEAARVLRDHFFGRPQPTVAPQLHTEPPAWAREILNRLAALEGAASNDHDGQIGPERAGVIRRQLVVFGQLMGHGDPKAAKSWRTMGDNELRDRLSHHRSKGRPWARLPVGRYGEALSKLEEMLTRARKVDVAHLEASQLPLKAS